MIYRKIFSKLVPKPIVQNEWKDNEYFDSAWKSRQELLSERISVEDISVCDFGCGPGWLKEFISENKQYYGVDYVKRDTETIVCDLNKGEFPNQLEGVDVAVCSGVIEYIENVEDFVERLAGFCSKVVMSYCSLEEIGALRARKKLAWKNHYYTGQLIEIFYRFDFVLVDIEYRPKIGSILVLKKLDEV